MAEYGDLFSQNFEQDVLKIAKKHLTDHKKVLVYRKFEVNMGEKQPKTKKELKELLDRKVAIVRKGFILALWVRIDTGDDEIDGLDKWLDGKQTSVSHLNYTKHTWEPRSVSRNDIPLHDVDFPFLLHDNTALVILFLFFTTAFSDVGDVPSWLSVGLVGRTFYVSDGDKRGRRRGDQGNRGDEQREVGGGQLEYTTGA